MNENKSLFEWKELVWKLPHTMLSFENYSVPSIEVASTLAKRGKTGRATEIDKREKRSDTMKRAEADS